MKIILNKQELTSFKAIAENIESGSSANIIAAIDKNPLIERRIACDGSGEMMLILDAQYMADALSESTKTVSILWPCLKAAYSTFKGYIRNLADMAEAHARRAKSERRREEARIANHLSNTSNDVSYDHVIKILLSNGVTKLTDLPAEVQNVIRNAYPADVIKAAEDTLEPNHKA